jgi:alanine racemase
MARQRKRTEAMQTTSVLRIDLAAVAHNMGVVRRIIGPDCAIVPVIKANAYGLGAPRIGKQLVTSGAAMLAVYTLQQATAIVRSALNIPILVLMPVREISRTDELYRWLMTGRLHLSVHDAEHLADLLKLAERYAVRIPVHVEVDTGMARGGCGPDALAAMLRTINQSRWFELAGLYTHFTAPESDVARTDRQLAAFEQLVAKHREMIPPTCVIHAAATYAMLRGAKYHKSAVRVGLAWAGCGSEWMVGGSYSKHACELRPAVTWESSIAQIKTIEAGATAGYGALWTAKRVSTLGLVPVGYADGYPMALGSTDEAPKPACVGVVLGDGEDADRAFVPVVGQVSMDQIMIDLTDAMASAPANTVHVGTVVELISPHTEAPNHLPNLAAACGTIPHEMLTRLGAHLHRQYETAAAHVVVPHTAPAMAV